MEDARAPQPEAGADATLRQRLIKRVTLAAVAVGVLLGGLAIIDSYYVPPPVTPPRTISATLPLAKPPAPSETASVPAAAEPAPVPETTTSPNITKPAAPDAKVEPVKPAVPLKHGVAKPAVEATAKPRPAVPFKAASHAERPPRQFVYQVGVFSDLDNARNLGEKLKQAGIPSRVEAKVQVGPFKTRKEAEEARKKLAALGLAPGTLLPLRK